MSGLEARPDLRLLIFTPRRIGYTRDSSSTPILLNTNTAGHYINRRRGVRERAISEVARGNRIGICIPVLGELWFGVENSASHDRNLQRLLVAVSDWTVWPYETPAAREYGRIATALKCAGCTIQQIDSMIAAIALTIGNCTVVSGDNDLSKVAGLTVENWASGV